MRALSRVTLIEDDCLKAMRSIPDGSINLILCDLPYGTTQNKWDSVIPLKALWREYERILAPQGAVVLTAQGPFTARLILSNEDWFKYKIVWEKSKPTNFLNAKKQPLRKHEDICVFYPRQPTYQPQMGEGAAYDKGVRKNQLTGSYGDFRPAHIKSEGGRYPTDVIYHKTAESEGQVYHATQKPVGLGRYLIRTYTKPGDVVLDNAFGSGSFIVAAAMEGRHAIGVELNQDVEAFKQERLDLIAVAGKRLKAVAACQVATFRGNLKAVQELCARWAIYNEPLDVRVGGGVDIEMEGPVIVARNANGSSAEVVQL
jgi:site-specific DNA-methyltransferase (adenine-specific)/modification methylase